MQAEIFAYMFPGMMVMWVFFIAQNVLADIYTERDRKTLMRLMASPVSVMTIVLSKFAHSFALCLLVEFVLIVLTSLVFGVKWGNPFWLLVVILTLNFAITGVLALLYGISKTRSAAEGLTVIVILSLGFLGGGFFPFNEMPALFQRIGEWTINRWAILSIQAVMNAKPLAEISIQILKLFLAGTITLACGVFLMKRRLEAGEGA
jgi:ABC-2 type transport system permease protein